MKRNEPWADNCSEELLDEPAVMHKIYRVKLCTCSEAAFLRLSDYPFS